MLHFPSGRINSSGIECVYLHLQAVFEAALKMDPSAQENTHAQWVLSQLNQQRELGRFCDVLLSTPSGQVFLAHRNVLACFSPRFLYATSSAPCMEVNLPEECSDDGLELLLHFFYTGKLQLDETNEEKVRKVAYGLSVPISLLSRFNVHEGPDLKGDVEGTFPSLLADAKLNLLDKGQSKSQQRVKTKPRMAVNSASAAVSFNDPCSSRPVLATTTRSGRRVKGPSRLIGENHVLAIKKQVAKEAVMKIPSLVAEDEDLAGAEKEPSSVQATELLQDGPADVYIDDVDQHDDNDENGVDIAAPLDECCADMDDDCAPHDSPDRPSTNLRANCKSTGKATDNKNGEGLSKDARKGSVQCPTCNKTFLSKHYLKVHNRRHTGEKPFECEKCGKCYYRKENLQEHKARNCLNRTDSVFSCYRCHMTFKRRQELRVHMVTHTGEMPNKCTSCSEQFMQKKDLKIHMIKVHGAPKPHACSLCTKCFLSRTELKLHEASKHRGEKLFVCEECGHRASSRNGLQMHIKAIHRNERPFVCEYCNHAFTQKANLNMHLRTHTGEKPFQCHLCGKTFRTQASLDKHHRTHTGERPFGCEFCQQRFTEKGPLLRHIASKHQEGRPHFCQICGKSFKAIEQLRVHVRRHKGMRKFECKECGYKFTRQAHLRRHSQIHNRVQNYNPRQRKLRNLVVPDESAAATAASTSTPTGQTDAPAGTELEQDRDSSIPPLESDSDQVSLMETAVDKKEHAEFGTAKEAKAADGGGEGFGAEEVMDHTVLVTDPFPIHTDLEVALEEKDGV